MAHYRINGHIYYITTNVYNFLPIFTRSPFVLPLVDSLNYYRYKYCFKLIGYVIMPTHMHLLIFPEDASCLEDLMRDYKKFTASRIIRQAEVERNQRLLDVFTAAGAETGRSERKVWQDSFWEMNIFSERFVHQKLNYIHRNPVRAELVTAPEKYPYSSYRNYVSNDDSWIEIDRGWK